ncbi:MAG: hypothetical protein CNF01_06195 [Halieaceae bacterium MED-G27]|nr:hypothetical protein [Halieaceae bacterium]OUT67751.1 MAG: hypothetical protein CBB81_00360 [Cellvibrionales bacterium TMED21]PDH36523.1 MAG: hypothetical protein CNF01_06195 [Halieaceae bacterium MED-G27]|tara:strand:+ start:1028 stop:1726 length:699 start_codon:yes stop_codon:yes gene_type:complete
MAVPLTRSSILLWVALAVPLAVMALRLTVLNPSSANLSCFEAERSFESVDFTSALPERPALLLGNRRVANWQATPEAMRGHEVVVRTVPGLAIENLDGCFPRLIGHYQPELVVVMIDAITDEREARSTLNAIEGIVAQRELYGLFFDLWVTPPIETPASTSGLSAVLSSFRDNLAQWAASQANVFIVNPSTQLSNEEGLPDPTLFWPNGDTLNSAGYKKLQTALQDAINARG